MIRTRSLTQLTANEVSEGWLAVTASSGVDDRSMLPFWEQRRLSAPASTLLVRDQGRDRFGYTLAATEGTVDLRNREECRRIVSSHETLCIDISGLAHHIWAPLIAAGLDVCADVRVVYAEPETYRTHPSPASHTVFDLTERFEGIEPLPGFARLKGPRSDQEALFVPFLGFEGARAKHIANILEPLPKTIPVIGVPGFRIELPTFTLTCNRDFIEDTRSASQLRFARASCPFEAQDALREIARDHPGAYLYLAPIGTKPHALGAVLYALQEPSSTEIIYDHPVRRARRSSGVGQIHVYSINRV